MAIGQSELVKVALTYDEVGDVLNDDEKKKLE